MGEIKKDLVRTKLPDREGHNSRMFIDLCENIHIHYREFRTVFSLDEYFEYAKILEDSTKDVRAYLAQNPDYREGLYGTTLMVAGGKMRQREYLKNSPQPNQSFYMNNDFAIELQTERTTDELHIHWRDYRFAMNREHFKIIADAFTVAREELEDYEDATDYVRMDHADREISLEHSNIDDQTKIMDEVEVDIDLIKTRFDNFSEDFKPDMNTIELIKKKYESHSRVFPLVLSSDNIVIDGQHRLFAAKSAGMTSINCIKTDITFDQSDKFRKVEAMLKDFDRETNYRFSTSAFIKEYFAYKMGKYYKDHFYKKLNPTFKTRFKNFYRDKKSHTVMRLRKSPFTYKMVRFIYRSILKPFFG